MQLDLVLEFSASKSKPVTRSRCIHSTTMVLKADQMRVKALLAETVTLLCKNGLHFKTKFAIEGLIGITLDDEDIFLVSINETINAADPVQENEFSYNSSEQLRQTVKRVRNKLEEAANRASLQFAENPASPILKSFDASSSIPAIPASCRPRSIRSSGQALPLSVANFNRDPRTAEASPGIGTFSGSNDSVPEFGNNSLPASSVGPSECDALTFHPVSIKSDAAAADDQSYEDNKTLLAETEQPTSKRIRLGHSELLTESSMPASSSGINSGSTVAKDTTKSEPSGVIEIKEESLSENETEMPNYSAYGEYNSTLEYGSSNAEMMQSFADSSMFQPSSSFYVPQQSEGNQNPDWSRQNAAGSGGSRPRSTHVRGSYKCQLCDRSFAWMTTLSQHEDKMHGRRPHTYRCQLCSKGFWYKRDLRGHLASKHQMQKDYSCSLCNKEFSYKRHYKSHMNSAHGGMQEEQQEQQD